MNFRRANIRFGSAPRDDRGVALVITLILLAVITFMAVTFLVLSNAEKAAAGTVKDQTTSRNAADAARDRFAADLMARIVTTGNPYDGGLLVSTNYDNLAGFDPSSPANPLTNVNFFYKQDGSALSQDESRQNLLNLSYDPRAPVYITDRFTGAEDFRFYYDINRNGRFDATGWVAVRDAAGQMIVNPTGGYYSNYVVGDPQWIGILERPEFPHSPSNRFVARFCYVAIPIGNALDVNYIHNLAGRAGFGGNFFLRNQGVGPWEINLPAFLADLNTNMWARFAGYYDYRPFNNVAQGDAFLDAAHLYNYRIASNLLSLASVSTLYGGSGSLAFVDDRRDGYSDGNLLSDPGGVIEAGAGADITTLPWAGAENTNHLFNHQDFFDTAKLGPIANKLTSLATSNSTYDNSTFSRLLEQLGTDSAPDRGKMNLNYDNLVARNPASGSVSETNFYAWTPLTFFTNAADRLLRANFNFGVDAIPVFTNGVFTYSPAVHRCLQLAANLAEVTATNESLRLYGFAMPNVFQPLVMRSNNGIYISGFREVSTVSGAGDLQLSAPLSLNFATNITSVPTVATNLNIYGVPWVIGARKGLPNFNEFAMQSVFQITRKLELRKQNFTSYTSRIGWQTNVMYVVGISNNSGVEAWNAYRANFNRGVDIYVDARVTMELTNTSGARLYAQYAFPQSAIVSAGQWRGWDDSQSKSPSLRVPMETNLVFLRDSIYRFGSGTFDPNLNAGFEDSSLWPGGRWPLPDWALNVTNQLRFIVRDRQSGRILDYVQLENLNAKRDLRQEIMDPNQTLGFSGLWSTNRLAGNVPQGIFNQLQVSLGNVGATADWQSYGLGQPTGDTKRKEIDKFRVFNGLTPLYYPDLLDTNLVIQAPFTPTKRMVHYTTWQANDPLVHYLPGDMAQETNELRNVAPNETIAPLNDRNLGHLNDRFEPWGGSKPKTGGQGGAGFPNAFRTAVKDPGVRKPDDWDFPTNLFPNVGWVGRVHRGSPWQTVYLKADDVDDAAWQQWSGNFNVQDARITKPRNDRIVFDLFTATVDENTTRGQLPINQTNLAAWSAVFSGVIALSNNSTLGTLDRHVIAPVAFAGTNGPLARIHEGILRTRNDRTQFPNQSFGRLGDILAVPELTERSPFMPDKNSNQYKLGMRDAVEEWLPQQIMGLLRFSEPRYVVYAYGQALRPAANSIVTSGPFFGLSTNYQVMAEIATRSVLRVENPRSGTPRVHLENYNILPPD